MVSKDGTDHNHRKYQNHHFGKVQIKHILKNWLEGKSFGFRYRSNYRKVRQGIEEPNVSLDPMEGYLTNGCTSRKTKHFIKSPLFLRSTQKIHKMQRKALAPSPSHSIQRGTSMSTSMSTSMTLFSLLSASHLVGSALMMRPRTRSRRLFSQSMYWRKKIMSKIPKQRQMMQILHQV